MLSFSANLSMLFTEVDFLDRFERASRAGFRAVECQFPYAYDAGAIAEQLRQNHLALVLHNMPAGEWTKGERGIACLPDRVGEFRDGVGQAIAYATRLRCAQVNCLAGLAPDAIDRDTLRRTLVGNLRFAARQLKPHGITLLIEPLNTRDTPGFFLQSSRQAAEIIDEVGEDNLFLQLDVYHTHIMEGNVAASLGQHVERIRHVQIADHPGRHEPGTGAIDFAAVFQTLERLNYRGWIGCEYIPSTTTEESLAWLHHQEAGEVTPAGKSVPKH